MANKKIKITDRESLTQVTIQAHIDAPANTGSWIAKIGKRAELVSQPAWDEIVRLRAALESIATSKAGGTLKMRKLAKDALENKD